MKNSIADIFDNILFCILDVEDFPLDGIYVKIKSIEAINESLKAAYFSAAYQRKKRIYVYGECPSLQKEVERTILSKNLRLKGQGDSATVLPFKAILIGTPPSHQNKKANKIRRVRASNSCAQSSEFPYNLR